MDSLRRNIIRQVENIPVGKIFTYQDLPFEPYKRANVAVVLSEMTKKDIIRRVEKGAYYRLKKSAFGLGLLSVCEDDILNYITHKYDGYITGADVYNKMNLTEQVPVAVTLATSQPVRPFKIGHLSVNCVKCYTDAYKDKELLPLVWLLDAIKDINRIPETSPQKAYDRLYEFHFRNLSEKEKEKITQISLDYPPRVRYILGDLMGKTDRPDLQKRLKDSLINNTKIKILYQTTTGK